MPRARTAGRGRGRQQPAGVVVGTVDDDVRTVASRAIAGETLATLALRPALDAVARLVPAGAVADIVLVLRGDELVARRP